MVTVPDELTAAIAAECAAPPRVLASAVGRLIEGYRRGDAAPIAALTRETDVLAYAAYRMPATTAAAASALSAVAAALPGFAPTGQLDLGGGTGAAVWAAATTWPSLTRARVVERSAAMADVGQRIAGHASAGVVRSATWQSGDIADAAAGAAELVTMAYVLGELPPATRAVVVDRALAASTGVVVVVEPGTPDGYARVIAARDRCIAAGWSVAAPCPHDAECPMRPAGDWCHFSVRLARSALHRQVKGGSLAYEDEKFSYVAAVRGDVAARCRARIVRHPLTRKGLVSLRLCTADDGLQTQPVSKRQGATYRAARSVSWGDCWDADAGG